MDGANAGVDRPWDEVLIVLVRYWKISCNLDNLSCLSCSGPFALVGLIGDCGESSRLKVAPTGEFGIDLCSSPTETVRL